MASIRKEVKFTDADADLIEYIEAQEIGFAPFIKQALREYIVLKESKVDYDRIRRIVEDVIDAKGISIASGEPAMITPKEVESPFKFGKKL